MRVETAKADLWLFLSPSCDPWRRVEVWDGSQAFYVLVRLELQYVAPATSLPYPVWAAVVGLQGKICKG